MEGRGRESKVEAKEIREIKSVKERRWGRRGQHAVDVQMEIAMVRLDPWAEESPRRPVVSPGQGGDAAKASSDHRQTIHGGHARLSKIQTSSTPLPAGETNDELRALAFQNDVYAVNVG